MRITRTVEVDLELNLSDLELEVQNTGDILARMRMALIAVGSLKSEDFQKYRKLISIQDPRVDLLEKWSGELSQLVQTEAGATKTPDGSISQCAHQSLDASASVSTSPGSSASADVPSGAANAPLDQSQTTDQPESSEKSNLLSRIQKDYESGISICDLESMHGRDLVDEALEIHKKFAAIGLRVQVAPFDDDDEDYG